MGVGGGGEVGVREVVVVVVVVVVVGVPRGVYSFSTLYSAQQKPRSENNHSPSGTEPPTLKPRAAAMAATQ